MIPKIERGAATGVATAYITSSCSDSNGALPTLGTKVGPSVRLSPVSALLAYEGTGEMESPVSLRRAADWFANALLGGLGPNEAAWPAICHRGSPASKGKGGGL